MWDKDIDRMVARTRSRPLASRVLSMYQAIKLFALTSTVSLFVLSQLNRSTIYLGLCSIPLILLYPGAKRVFSHPQLVLGITFNWGCLMAFTMMYPEYSVAEVLQNTAALPLYTACVFWTLLYDTIYAHQDKVDDAIIGVKSSALSIGDRWAKWFLGAYSAITVACLSLSVSVAGLAWPAWAAVLVATGHFAWQVKVLKLDQPEDCLKKFKSNHELGFIVFLGMAAGAWFSNEEAAVERCTDPIADPLL